MNRVLKLQSLKMVVPAESVMADSCGWCSCNTKAN